MVSNLIVAICAVIPLFFLMLVGFAVKKMRLLTELELAHVNRMVFKIFFFFMMFYNIYITDLASTVRPGLMLFGAAGVFSVFLAATCRIVENLARDRSPAPWQAMAMSVRRPAGALVQLVLYLVVTALASSLFLLPFALLLIAFFAVSMPAAVIEDRGFIAAFRRSAQLTKGKRWRAVFLSALLIWIGFSVPGAIGGIVLLVTGWPFWITNLLVILLSAVLLPLSAIGLTLQFYDFRQEDARDGVDRIEQPV